MTFDNLPEAVVEIFGAGASAEEAFGLLTVDVPATAWTGALAAARDELGCGYFDWLSAVDELADGFFVVAHLAAVGAGAGQLRHLLLRTRVPRDNPELPSATSWFPGAAWHERETHEMFGVNFTGHPHLVPLLLPEEFEGHPLRKEFVLAARVAKAWPGAKEPGESGHGGPKRRQMQPPGVPDPNEWGPLKGKLGPEPTRGRAARAGRAGRVAPGERPVRADRPRRTRTAAQGSVSQAAPEQSAAPEQAAALAPGDTPDQETGRHEREAGAAQ